MSGLSGIPSTVVQAALGGKHSPIVPQRQRLLVAAKKTQTPQQQMQQQQLLQKQSRQQQNTIRLLQSRRQGPKQRTTTIKTKRAKAAEHHMQIPNTTSRERRSLLRSLSEHSAGTLSYIILEFDNVCYMHTSPGFHLCRSRSGRTGSGFKKVMFCNIVGSIVAI